MDQDVKLRSVCDGCTSAKVRCNGKMPCERCLRKGVECHYLPFKHRGGQGGAPPPAAAKAKAASNVAASAVVAAEKAKKVGDFNDSILDPDERKTWSVFFTLYRSFAKGCSLFWFKQQLFKMLRFLESRALTDPNAANALGRLRSWMTALGVDVQSPPLMCVRPPQMKYENLKTPTFQSSLDDIVNEARARDLPMLEVSSTGAVTVNAAFERVFAPTVAEMEKVLADAAGGFLPWSGDILARLFAKESDLVIYLQGIANNLDAIGRPTAIPCVQAVPSMSLVRLKTKDNKEMLTIVKAVQVMHVDLNQFSFTSTVVFDVSQHAATIPSNVRSFSEMEAQGNVKDEEKHSSHHAAKRLYDDHHPDADLFPHLPHEAIAETEDEMWLESLLDWAAEDPSTSKDGMFLPVADDMFDLDINLDAPKDWRHEG